MGEAVQTMPRRLLGGELKRLRLAAGKSLDESGALIGKDRSRLIKVEDGRSTLKANDLEQLLTFYGATARDRKKVLAMGVEARQRQPKRAYVDLLPGAHSRIADLEADATTISYYDRGVVPGLLQIPEYTEGLVAACDGVWWPTPSYEERARRVAFRLERQKLLPDKEFEFIFTDDALTTPVAGREVMRRQVEHLLGLVRRPNISLRLVESNDPWNPCPQGALVLLEFEGARRVGLLPVAYGPSMYLDDPTDTDSIDRGFQRLRKIALSEEESRSRLEAALEAT
ncbi:transcriptional regulator with XRE-family HTH domain [Saccharothrix tamanrassetensis]|uniref:Transcriptional regulator with XRE-family HTH domain n=1 Tax=Saccharothrix tamanrassetensis TaxID=1051531 RepID=A0A841CY60_9PSEU|nr:helix-turn-helix transcriptional regulator [Saccharothrix tamanrassetensis]MBB5960276.1 transcriptional regulator with XRE-family HTH domain [Saccharothrix tamanrassetensis]